MTKNDRNGKTNETQKTEKKVEFIDGLDELKWRPKLGSAQVHDENDISSFFVCYRSRCR